MGESFRNEAIYVAVNQDVRESKKTLEWTLKHLHVKKICLLHVHIPFPLTSSSSWINESEINAIQESQVKDSYESLYKYCDICTNKGINEEDVDISLISGYSVGEGIVELIYQNNIKKLVMGAAVDAHYSRGMSITSRKAEYVIQHTPNCCKMWLICKGKLIKTKKGSFGIGNPSNSFSGFYGFTEHESIESPKEHSKPILETQESPKKTRKGHEKKPESNESDTKSSPCPPQDYICPISLEIMQNPHLAADGHSYEGEVMRTWLREGGQTSPKTGARLSHHNLTPNYTLRSLIQDWVQKHPNYSAD